MTKEVQNWPYSFPASDDFQKSDQRGNVTDRLFVLNRYDFVIFYIFEVIDLNFFPELLVPHSLVESNRIIMSLFEFFFVLSTYFNFLHAIT